MIKNVPLSRKKSLNFKMGMEQFVQSICSKVSKIELSRGVRSIEKTDKQILVTFENGNQTLYDSIVLALPSFECSKILKGKFEIKKIESIRYAPMVSVYTAYKKGDVDHALNGFGGLNPFIEKQFSLGSLWTSSVFDQRCPDGEVIFTTFVGGDKQRSKAELEDWVIKLKVHEELCKNFNINADQPVYQFAHRWEKALPQYDIHLADAHHEIEDLEKDNIFICSNWKDGVSLSDCIKKAKLLASKI